jgi:isopentenyl-diphosphate delta-isomerase
MTIMIPAWVDGTLQPVEKLQAHIAGLRHMAVSVFVVCNDAILIQQRALTKYHTPGLWANTCCTHPDWAENPFTCAQRRLTEELGINNLDLVHRGIVEYRADVGSGMIEHEVVDMFVAHAPRDLPMDLNPQEVAAVAWVSIPDLRKNIAANPDRFTPWLRIYLTDHSDRIFDTGV